MTKIDESVAPELILSLLGTEKVSPALADLAEEGKGSHAQRRLPACTEHFQLLLCSSFVLRMCEVLEDLQTRCLLACPGACSAMQCL